MLFDKVHMTLLFLTVVFSWGIKPWFWFILKSIHLYFFVGQHLNGQFSSSIFTVPSQHIRVCRWPVIFFSSCSNNKGCMTKELQCSIHVLKSHSNTHTKQSSACSKLSPSLEDICMCILGLMHNVICAKTSLSQINRGVSALDVNLMLKTCLSTYGLP